MISKNKVLNYVERESNSDILKSLLWIIIDYIYNNTKLSHIEYGSIRNLVGEKYRDEDIISAVQMLSFGKYPVLDVGYEYIDGSNMSFAVSKKAVKEAEKYGNLVHPNTGRLIPKDEYKKNLFLYFVPIYQQ